MHPTLHQFNVLPGDRIVEPKSNLRIVQHHSVYLGQDIYGVDWIVENKIGCGVQLVTANEYFRNVIEITRIERFSGNGNQRKAAVQRALAQVGQPYNLINYNCEGFANYVQHGQNYSKQANNAVGLGLIFGIGLLLAALSSEE